MHQRLVAAASFFVQCTTSNKISALTQIMSLLKSERWTWTKFRPVVSSAFFHCAQIMYSMNYAVIHFWIDTVLQCQSPYAKMLAHGHKQFTQRSHLLRNQSTLALSMLNKLEIPEMRYKTIWFYHFKCLFMTHSSQYFTPELYRSWLSGIVKQNLTILI